MAEASVTVVLVGGMEGMEGEHDEEFSLDLTHQGAGLYSGEGAVGPRDLILTGLLVRIRGSGELWSFPIPANELGPPEG